MKIIQKDGLKYALHFNFDNAKESKNFITDHTDPFQVGVFNLKKNENIERHVHNEIEREVKTTSEALIVLNGKIKVSFYDQSNLELVDHVIVVGGELLLMLNGGHSLEILEDSKFLEVKQGPYIEEMDKRHF